MIEKGKYYVNRFTAGRYHVYLALEDVEEMDLQVKVIDLTDDSMTFIGAEHILEVESEKIDEEYLEVAKKYL